MNHNSSEESKMIKIGLGVAVVVVVAWIASAIILSGNPNRGTIGDMFGAVNALFSGLAFAGVVVAILLQRLEMQQSRSEFVKSAEEQRKFYEEERRSNSQETSSPW